MDPQKHFSFIELLEEQLAKMPKEVHSVSNGNRVRIIDTPHVWGKPMTEDGVKEGALASVGDLAKTVKQIIGGATVKVDIVSLNPPGGLFETAVWEGLEQIAQSGKQVLVRFLFGYVPFRDTVTKFTSSLADFCQVKAFPMNKMTILIGQLYQYLNPSWNHAKIVAADGAVAVVGGHNLWDNAYGQYPPVHDISVQVIGPAAADAQKFADFIWCNGGTNLVVHQIGGNYKRAELDAGAARNQVTVPRLDLPGPAHGKAPDWPAGRILSLGRAGTIGNSGYNASDIAKRLIIKNAQRSLKICQQDLLFLGMNADGEHLVCDWIAEAMIANPGLTVQIIVSPIGASGGGDQYSWGCGAIYTYQFITRQLYLKSGADLRIIDKLTSRLQVAPFCFTAVSFDQEGTDYCWPGARHVSRFGPRDKIPRGDYAPAPGNHSKVYLADDYAYYVGSDNLYPHNLAEFGYLIEGDPVAMFIADYWNKVWKYSEPHVVTDEMKGPL